MIIEIGDSDQSDVMLRFRWHFRQRPPFYSNSTRPTATQPPWKPILSRILFIKEPSIDFPLRTLPLFSLPPFPPFATLNMSTRNTSYSAYNAEASDSTTLFGTDCWQKQVLPTPYINRKRLLAKLRSRYGENGFRVQVCSSCLLP
jgi:hypothetical protein